MKKEYIKPDFEITCFEIDDIITLSGGDLGPGDNVVEPWNEKTWYM